MKAPMRIFADHSNRRSQREKFFLSSHPCSSNQGPRTHQRRYVVVHTLTVPHFVHTPAVFDGASAIGSRTAKATWEEEACACMACSCWWRDQEAVMWVDIGRRSGLASYSEGAAMEGQWAGAFAPRRLMSWHCGWSCAGLPLPSLPDFLVEPSDAQSSEQVIRGGIAGILRGFPLVGAGKKNLSSSSWRLHPGTPARSSTRQAFGMPAATTGKQLRAQYRNGSANQSEARLRSGRDARSPLAAHHSRLTYAPALVIAPKLQTVKSRRLTINGGPH